MKAQNHFWAAQKGEAIVNSLEERGVLFVCLFVFGLDTEIGSKLGGI
jgi:hypothetical protein